MSKTPALLLCAVAVLSAAETPEQIEFFEKRIRPVLVEQCYACHSSETAAMGQLRLDSRQALLKGGSRGPAVRPGDSASSLLLEAISYRNLDLKMPPTGKLTDEQIGDFHAWVEMGAPDPRVEPAAAEAAAAPPEFDLEARRAELWSFQPIRDPQVPAVNDSNWSDRPIDRFLLAKMEAAGLQPAPPADKRTLIRRLSFDLTGLPPTPEETAAFLADDSPQAYSSLVERLLASPHYGERWGRHWLDLVRFAETNGHEFDNNKLDAWRYRDYVVQAFNDDLPYDQFIREQIAGDLLEGSRPAPDGLTRQTPIGSGFYWLWEVLNSPTDSLKARADQVDNQIDVLGKAVFGLTLACARCHDHKFDPVSTRDYYALAGIMHSTQLRERLIDSDQRHAQIDATRRMLGDLDSDIRHHLAKGRRAAAADLAGNYLAPEGKWADYRQYAAAEPSHPLYPLAKLAQDSEQPFAERQRALRAEMRDWAAKADRGHPSRQDRGDQLFDDFSSGYEKWNIDGAAFGREPVRTLPTNDPLSGALGQPLASSFAGADEFVGILTTRKFIIPSLYIHVRMAGTAAGSRDKEEAKFRVTLWADDHPSQNLTPSGDHRLAWKTVRLTKEIGRLGYLQISDRGRDGYIAVDQIVFSDSPEPPPIAGPVQPRVRQLLDRPDFHSLQDLSAAYADLALRLLDESSDDPADQSLLQALEGPGAGEKALDRLQGLERTWASDLIDLRRSRSRALPPSAFAMSSMDREPHNVRLHLRGNHKNLGEEVPRGFLAAFAGPDQLPIQSGSGRLELADWAVSEQNPLTARVIVNRVWQHHFGRGLVATVDNFGKSGEAPSHPDLLDYLASRFIESGWSIKQLHRDILLTRAYRQQSAAAGPAAELDPANKLLSHMPVRRLEAEAIRDAVLTVAGTLDPTVGGPSVPPHISAFQDGRGKPESGPLDGDGRRSLYIGVRRNFITPMFLAFDYPTPVSTIGGRGVSAVPSQALILLNNELIIEQAGKWAQAEIERRPSDPERVSGMFEQAFARPPQPDEVSESLEFIRSQAERHGGGSGAQSQAWADLAHVLINSAEFIFVR